MSKFLVKAMPKNGLTQVVFALNKEEAIYKAKRNPGGWAASFDKFEREWLYTAVDIGGIEI